MTLVHSLFGMAAAVRRTVLALAIASVVAPASTRATPRDASVEQRNETVVRDAFAAWAAGRNIFTSLLAPDIVWTIHGSGPIAGTYRCREDFLQRAAMPLTSRLATPLAPKVHDIWPVGDTGDRPLRSDGHDHRRASLPQPVRLDLANAERLRGPSGSLP